MLFVIIPFNLYQSAYAEKNYPFISRIEGKLTASIIINESPTKVWEILTNYKGTGEKMPDIKQVKLLKDSSIEDESNILIIAHNAILRCLILALISQPNR